jgi:hypothetical protein
VIDATAAAAGLEHPRRSAPRPPSTAYAAWLGCLIGCAGPLGPDAGLDAPSAVDVGHDGAGEGPDDAGDACPTARLAACTTGGYAGFDVSLPAALSARGTVVVDARSGLTWQRATDGTRRTFDAAAAYCEALELEGEHDFRLPTRIELLSLVVLGASPTIDPLLAPTAPDYHWTQSVPSAFPTTSAFSVYFGAGEVAYALRDRPTGLNRCVAGSPSVEGERFVAEDRGIRDRGTGLLWATSVVLDVAHDELAARCAPGRAPTLLELASIVDEARSGPAIDPIFGATPPLPSWTASIDAMGPRVVDFEHGETATHPAGELANVRCLVE